MARWLIAALLLPALVRPADACSCREDRRPLSEQLESELAEASDVYRARVLQTSGGHCSSSTKIEVLENFKGTTGPGQTFDVKSGGCGDCTIDFRVGAEYLVYGFGSPLSVGMCTRTHEVSPGDVEVEWLRSKRLPLSPVALQREQVTCRTCDFDVTTRSLVTELPAGCNTGLWNDEAKNALAAQRPFWTHAGPERAVGLSGYLAAFELRRTPGWASDDACRQRVVRRWCEGLALDAGVGWSCLGATRDEELCDENDSRAASWGPIESLSAAECTWDDATFPSCELQPSTAPLPAGARIWPLLRCSPHRELGGSYRCHVVIGPEQTPRRYDVRP